MHTHMAAGYIVHSVFTHDLRAVTTEGEADLAESLRESGVELLKADGCGRIVQVLVPGPEALSAANPSHQTTALELDCGLIFKSPLPPEWIIEIESL
jgi:hypothetical protein